MTVNNLSKVYVTKPVSTLDFTTVEYLSEYLKIIKAKSHLPINKMFSILSNKESDMVSCSRDDTEYSFFASRRKGKISVIIKNLDGEIIEFDVQCKDVVKIIQKSSR